MSRPHFHPDERYALVLKGTWYTGEGDAFEPGKTVGLKPDDDMRHPKGGHHYDGALDEEVLVAISGYGPTGATSSTAANSSAVPNDSRRNRGDVGMSSRAHSGSTRLVSRRNAMKTFGWRLEPHSPDRV